MANTMTLKKLYEIKEKYMPSIDIRRGMQKNNLYQIMVCGGTGCHSCESAEVLHAFNTSIQNHKLKNVSAMAVGCSCIGAGWAVAKAAPAALGAVSENPDNFGRAIIFVALGEGVAIYGLLISILILNNL